jgi:CubicO group peptidase (beta-lactamase class C family)
MSTLNKALIALAALSLVAAGAPPKSNSEILQIWLTAFNAGDTASLKAFQQDYLGNAQTAFAVDSREESGGFDLVKIERNDPLGLTALLRERDVPAIWRATFTRESADSSKLTSLKYHPLAVTRDQANAALDAFANKLAARDKFSGVLLISQGGKTLFGKSWGLANNASQTPNTMDTKFYFASQGKMFTAISILQLVDAGKIKLEDPLGKYLPDYANAEVRKVTVRQLLTHQGGMGEMGILEPGDDKNRAVVHSIADVIHLNEGRGPAFAPGSKAEYSNYGFLLLGAVVEKASGENFYTYVRRHIFEPAGMTHSGYPLRENTTGIAIGYTNQDGPIRSSIDQLPWRGTPAGGGVATAGDMVRFVSALNAGKLISAAMLAEATKKQIPWYGYGFIVSGDPDFPFWGHGGGAPGNSLVLSYYPVSDVTFVCMANRDPIVCDRLAGNYYYRQPRTR